MLSVAALRGPQARVEYLFDGALSEVERTGSWLGSACPKAGVPGLSRVDPGDLLHCLEGFAPGDSASLQARRHTNRIAGWDFTFSVSKSLSVAAEDDDLAAIILPAFTAALPPALLFIEHAVSPRHDRDPDDVIAPYPLFAAAFIHRSNRWNEPHLHAHVIIPNTCVTPAGWRALRERHVAGNCLLTNAVFQRELLRRIEPSGLVLINDPIGGVSLPLVPQEVCAGLSSGRSAILDFERQQPPSARKTSRSRYRTKSGKGRMVANFAVRPEKRASAQGRIASLPSPVRDRLRESFAALRASLRPATPSAPPAPPTRDDFARAFGAVAALGRPPTTSDLALGASRYRGGLIIDRLHAAGQPLAVATAAVRSTWRALRGQAKAFRAILTPSSRRRRALRSALVRHEHLAAVQVPTPPQQSAAQAADSVRR